MIETRETDIDEYRRNPFLKDVRILFSNQQFASWTGIDYPGDVTWVEPISGKLDLECCTWSEENDPMAPVKIPEGWVQGAIVLENDGVNGLRHYVTPQTTPQIIDDDEEDACAFESCLSSEIGQKAIRYAETNLERKLSKYEREKLICWCVKFTEFPDCRDPETIVIAVLERCVTKNDLSSMIAYINVVLEDFYKNSIITLEQVGKEYQKLKNSQRDRSLGKPKPNPVLLEKKEDSRPSSKYEGFYL